MVTRGQAGGRGSPRPLMRLSPESTPVVVAVVSATLGLLISVLAFLASNAARNAMVITLPTPSPGSTPTAGDSGGGSSGSWNSDSLLTFGVAVGVFLVVAVVVMAVSWPLIRQLVWHTQLASRFSSVWTVVASLIRKKPVQDYQVSTPELLEIVRQMSGAMHQMELDRDRSEATGDDVELTLAGSGKLGHK